MLYGLSFVSINAPVHTHLYHSKQMDSVSSLALEAAYTRSLMSVYKGNLIGGIYLSSIFYACVNHQAQACLCSNVFLSDQVGIRCHGHQSVGHGTAFMGFHVCPHHLCVR
jgi:hypothetical protein